jgi:signal transduction histidine kinase/ActR/RegA family two-component response regulator
VEVVRIAVTDKETPEVTATVKSNAPVAEAIQSLRDEKTVRSELEHQVERIEGTPVPANECAEPLDVTDDPETLGTVFEAIRLIAGGVALIFVGYTVYNLTRLDTPGVTRVMLLDVGAFLIAGVIFWLAYARRVSGAWIHVLSATLALSVAVDIAMSVRFFGEASDLDYMIAVAIGGASIVVATRWLSVILVGTAGLGLWAVLGVGSHNQLVDFIVSQIGATIVAIVIFVGRVRGYHNVLKFRIRDAQTTRELKAALKRAEREFLEHQASEQQKIDLMEQLRQSQKLEALGTLAGGIAHDINNVIGAITAIASTSIRELPTGTDGRKELKQILVAARRGTTLTRNLVRFARQEPPRNAPFNLDEVVVEVDTLLRRTLAKQIELKTDCGCSGWSIVGDAGLISHALMNLCLNSADAISDRGHITIQTRIVELDVTEAQQLGVPPGNYAELKVSDDGHGMSPEVLERAFEPFFSTKDSKRRSGLGLPMVYGTIQQHRGGLKVDSEPELGTKIRIVLPALNQPVVPAEQPSDNLPYVDTHRPLALFVDDELLLRKAGKRMLTSLGYEVMLASDGREALEKFERYRHRIGVVVLDVAMPIMSGAECCKELRRIDPAIPVLLVSGFPKGHDLKPLLIAPNTRYLCKPYELDELAKNLAELGEMFRPSTRLSCQVNFVRISIPAQRVAVESSLGAEPQSSSSDANE